METNKLINSLDERIKARKAGQPVKPLTLAAAQTEFSEFKLKPIGQIMSADEARDLAITWQQYASQATLSYGELFEFQIYFEALANKFGLTDEFKENAII